ncbi:ABC transporter substrate-binding protein [Truepera radiovictrix]|uniref:Extracellular solute-binding protein family 5 n=1 Tax=Truepera radiovictrix (strain DSM 17093 / CIP 108686 / LMG 22925 / RQ-24) TaxID=649638 RepID=D7CVU9_TRURR|nr:ABC transporter substrate-binding protein [Truepera radiovictrix]ADI16010.1 extracellular solute-binding protein family 5 [Truepera radiovictrix DSM 17093]WMT58364.1 ABC transporter substrate-binding protein [Truepera radiovictrix]
MTRPTRRALLALALAAAPAALAQAPADTYVVNQFGAPVTLDPARNYDSASSEIIENLYETLYTYDGEAIDAFVPQLATGYEVSEDGTVYTFTLREGVPFHSGNTLTCRDVEYSFERGFVTAHPEGAFSYLLGAQLLGTQTDGTDPEAYQQEVSFADIDGAIECPDGDDGLTVQFTLRQADPAFLSIIVYSAFSIVDSQWAIENGMWDGTEATWTEWIGRDLTQEFMQNQASGTGAYRLVSWETNSLIAERFDDYWGGAPALEAVVYNYVDEQATNILALTQGDADRIVLGDRAGLAQLRGAPGVRVVEQNEAGEPFLTTVVTSIFFNYDINTANNEDVGSGQLDGNGIPADFFQDENVRLGFAHLFDQQAFVDQVLEGQGQALTMGLPPTFLGYNPDVEIRTLDLEAAEEHFRAAYGGELWDTGFQFTALYNEGNTARQIALQIIAQNLSELNPNFRMNVRGLPWADYLSRTDQRLAPLFALGWAADYADPRNFINTFYSNEGFYAARTSIDFPEMQALIDQANSIIDQEERAALYQEIGQLHYELAPLIIVPAQFDYLAVRENLQGYYYNPMLSGNFFWKDLSKN